MTNDLTFPLALSPNPFGVIRFLRPVDVHYLHLGAPEDAVSANVKACPDMLTLASELYFSGKKAAAFQLGSIPAASREADGVGTPVFENALYYFRSFGSLAGLRRTVDPHGRLRSFACAEHKRDDAPWAQGDAKDSFALRPADVVFDPATETLVYRFLKMEEAGPRGVFRVAETGAVVEMVGWPAQASTPLLQVGSLPRAALGFGSAR